MSTIQEIRAGIQRDIDELERQINADRNEIKATLDNASAQGRNALTLAEDARAEALFRSIEAANAAKRRKADALTRAIAIEDEERQQETRLLTTHSTSAARASGQTASIRVGNEPHTYRAPAERTRTTNGDEEPGYLVDLYRAQVLGDPSANERIARHGQEMCVDNPARVKRAVGNAGVPGFLPPQYLTELFAVFARAGRPTANLCRSAELPAEGMSVNIPRVITSTKTGTQATDNATIANQDPASTLLTATVNTIGGYVVVSRQSIERGPLTEQIIASDLAADYNMQLDAQVLNGSGTAGQHLGILNVGSINAVTYTAATPVLVGVTTPMWPKLASGIGQIVSGRFQGPTAIVMSGAEWAWMMAATTRALTARLSSLTSRVAHSTLLAPSTGRRLTPASLAGFSTFPFTSTAICRATSGPALIRQR